MTTSELRLAILRVVAESPVKLHARSIFEKLCTTTDFATTEYAPEKHRRRVWNTLDRMFWDGSIYRHGNKPCRYYNNANI